MSLLHKSRQTTIRRSLLGNLVALVALTGGAIVITSWFYGQRILNDFSKLVVEPTTQRIAEELDGFFGEVRAQALVGLGWARRNALDATDYVSLNTIFVPILEQHPQLSSMMVANSDGVEYLLLRDALKPNIWHNRVVRADEWGTRVFNRRWDTVTGEVEEGFGELDYDPRRRIWYQEALQTTDDEPVAWSQPVIFFVTKDPGITASTHVDRTEGQGSEPHTTVVAFDLLLLDISRFTSQLAVSERGRAFVLVERDPQDELRVVGLPRDKRFGDDAALRRALTFLPPESAVADTEARLPTVDELDIPVVKDSVTEWKDKGRPRQSVRFKQQGQTWLAGFRPYTVGPNTFWIGVTLPERDVLGGIREQRRIILGIVAVILAFGLVRAAILARRFSDPIESLVQETARISEGNLEASEHTPSNIGEFRRLAGALDEMREALKAKRKLDRIEHDLQIAKEIQTGLLPTSHPEVPGFEIQGWNKTADETGGDYFDWLTLPDGRTLVVLADASGHGIGPALMVSVCRAYLRAAAIGAGGALSEAITQVNDLLEDDIPDGHFVTAAVGVLDSANYVMELLSAGQAPLFYYRARSGTVERWKADDIPLGIDAGYEFTAPRTLRFEPGDSLVLVTDGFFEWPNPGGEPYGTKRLEIFVSEHAHLTPGEFVEALYKTVSDHAAGEPQPDDLTVVVVKRT